MQNFSDILQEEHFQIWGSMERVAKMCIFNGKLAVSRKRWVIWPMLLLITS